jgi:peptide deformylase
MTKTNSPQLILVEPIDQILNRVADEITQEEVASLQIQDIIDRMLELSAGKGHNEEDSRQMVGLAAPQLVTSKRIVTIDVTADGSNKKQNLKVFINPKITYHSKETMPGREGCWSCGNICGNVERAKVVTLEGLDRNGKHIKFDLTDFVARIAQHETDHLDGIRFPDRISIDEPDRLHWVEHAKFEEYRKNWEHWPVKCPRQLWESLKAGAQITAPE